MASGAEITDDLVAIHSKTAKAMLLDITLVESKQTFFLLRKGSLLQIRHYLVRYSSIPNFGRNAVSCEKFRSIMIRDHSNFNYNMANRVLVYQLDNICSSALRIKSQNT